MATLTLPSTVPAPEATDFEWDADTGLLRTEMGNGNARQRRRFDTLPQKYRLTWYLTRAQYNALLFFFKRHADEFFNVDLPSMDGTGVKTTVEARLISNLQSRYLQTNTWSVSAAVEVLIGNPPDPDLDTGFILLESGDYLLQENNDRIKLETGNDFV